MSWAGVRGVGKHKEPCIESSQAHPFKQFAFPLWDPPSSFVKLRDRIMYFIPALIFCNYNNFPKAYTLQLLQIPQICFTQTCQISKWISIFLKIFFLLCSDQLICKRLSFSQCQLLCTTTIDIVTVLFKNQFPGPSNSVKFLWGRYYFLVIFKSPVHNIQHEKK